MKEEKSALKGLRILEREMQWLLESVDISRDLHLFLSEEEIKVLEKRVVGKSYNTIAAALGISPKKVKALCLSGLESIKLQTIALVMTLPIFTENEQEATTLKRHIQAMQDSNAELVKKVEALLQILSGKESMLNPSIPDGDKRLIDIEGISARVINSLYSEKIYTLSDLASYSRIDLIKFRNLGKKGIAELQQAVLPYNVRL